MKLLRIEQIKPMFTMHSEIFDTRDLLPKWKNSLLLFAEYEDVFDPNVYGYDVLLMNGFLMGSRQTVLFYRQVDDDGAQAAVKKYWSGLELETFDTGYHVILKPKETV